MKKVYFITVTIIYLLLMRIFWQTVSADEAYVGSRNVLKSGNFERALNLANKSVSKNPREPRYYYGRAKVLLASTIKLSGSESIEVKKRALYDLQTAQNLNMRNLVTLRNVVPLYYFLASGNLEGGSGINNIDPLYLPVTRDYFNSIKHYSPTDVGIYTLLAKYERRLGFTNELNDSLENVARLRPDLLNWYLN